MEYTVILQPEADPEFPGYYNVIAPALPGCFSYGANKEEALKNIREAIELYLEDLEARGESPPKETLEQVKVRV
ncbi:MAG: type II toxin-antitoxin system HicB family antitoxin [Chloroflexi bacterium]|nr:type II toxin-antitoxin system HicB family antitoxin [Chloroflexota bacterium]